MGREVFESVSEQLRGAVALEYKGIVFCSWAVDEEIGHIWAVMCEGCVQKYGDLLPDELYDGPMVTCGVKGCHIVGNDSDCEKSYFVDFNLELIEALDFDELEKRHPELVDLDMKICDAKCRIHDEAALYGPDRENWEMGM